MNRFENYSSETISAISNFQPEEKATLDNNVVPELKDLIYTCLLIPRIDSHKLLDNLANYLPRWMQQVCIPHNWQIEFFTIGSDYFQWGLRVTSTTQVSQFMQEIRRGTSELILSNLEHIRKENPTDDFWAAGYLVLSGKRPNQHEMIEQYLRMARRQQGFSAPEILDLYAPSH